MGVFQNFLVIVLIPQIFSKILETEFTCPVPCICDTATKTTRCKAIQLTNLTGIQIHPKTISLDLSYNKLNYVPPEIKQLFDLQYLYLQHNQIGSVTSKDFGKLENLRYIDLSANNLPNKQSIDMDFLIPLNDLLVLDLSQNPLHSFPDVNDVKNNNLQVLNFAQCSITNILTNILKGFENIKSLNLSKNPIQHLQHLESKSLIKLNVSDCDIHHISLMHLRGLPALKTLSIARNHQLKTFNSSSNSLTDVDLSDCNLNMIPWVYFPELRNMNLHGNSIHDIPANAFQGIPEINTLTLSNNVITFIDEEAFSGLSNLSILDLSYNRINQLKMNTFKRTTQLSRLRLSYNYIKSIKLHVPNLRYLDASHCEIKTVSAKDLVYMPELLTLNISNNWLYTLPNDFIGNNLRYLDVSMCSIYTLNNYTFAKMPNLQRLKLQGNGLSYQIGKDTFHDIKEIYLGGNPWRCNCDNIAFRKLYLFLREDGRRTDHYDLLCRSPVGFEGKHWYEACGDAWDDQTDVGKIWMHLIWVIIFCIIAFCILWYTLRSCSAKKKREQEIIRQIERRDVQVSLQRMRRQALESREEVDRNAPDPRDIVGPPAYDEAILLPPVISRSHSLSTCVPSAECGASTSATESTVNIPLRKSFVSKNKRRRRRCRSAALSSSTDGIISFKGLQGMESRVDSTTPSPITTEREDNNETTSVTHTSPSPTRQEYTVSRV